MKNRISNYYCLTYNSKCAYNLIDSNIIQLDKIYALRCKSTTITTYLQNKFKKYFIENDHVIEIIHNPLDNTQIDGIINITLNIGIICEYAIDKIFGTTVFIDLNKSIKQFGKNSIEEIEHTKNINTHLNSACEYFRKAKVIHDDWEEVYLESMDFEKADEIADDVINAIFKTKDMYDTNKNRNENNPLVRVRFFGAISPNGATNYVEEIIENIENRYYIKGKPGTGKSTMMKKIANKAQDYGFDVDIYNCASDVDSVDMVVIDALDTCIFDSTFPHEFFPTRDNDIVIDLYEKLLPENFDENNSTILNNISSKYKKQINAGILKLKEVRTTQKKLDSYYSSSIDFDEIENIYTDIIEELSN
ncbi:hypothetical protein JYG23_07645 [Sedimentibacter sp. zth1]|uniref:hypothetical protein n=1 Tax=Sedimentibacter sp. zth1 TaxID=2816908 RepID=UPI001A931C33|nr:hypothetical protein [Sedimentibacter sp. zth1]QSX07206.1 hypothetical protein JYG23_07645 [Sedimentibacter sp. zth1]